MAFLLIFNDSICALLYLGAFFCIRESKKKVGKSLLSMFQKGGVKSCQ